MSVLLMEESMIIVHWKFAGNFYLLMVIGLVAKYKVFPIIGFSWLVFKKARKNPIILLFETLYKLDGVGPVDNRPSTV